MKPIGKALMELRTVLFSIGMFYSLIDSFIVLLFSLLILILFRLPWEIAFVPFIIFFIWNTRKQLRKLGYSDVERRVPQLSESLRTAADSLSRDNEVVKALHEEVLNKMKLIKTSAFMGFSKITRQLLIIGVLAFLIISVSALNLKFLDATTLLERSGAIGSGNFWDNAKSTFFGIKAPEDPNAVLFEQQIDLLDETELYGNATVIELGIDELNLEVSPELSGVAIGDVRDPEDREFTDQTTPTDIQATSDSTFSEDIPAEYRGIVRNYFKAIPK